MCHQLFGQSATKGITFVHGTKEMTIFRAHSFINGGSGLLPGIVGTKRNGPTFLSFAGNASVANVSDGAHVDGYVKNYNIPNFIFPVGDNGVYGPVGIDATTLSSPVTSAYFRANPDVAVTSSVLGGNELPLPAGAPFSTLSMGIGIIKVSKIEYWDLNGTSPVKITLYWNSGSQINTLTGNMLSSLRLSGWDGSKWVEIPAAINLGSSLVSGSITSNTALAPNQYNVYTFGSTDCVNKSLLTISDLSCNGSTYNISFLSNGAFVTTSAGTISGNSILNIPIGTNVTLSADNGLGCLNRIVVTGPKSCTDNCILPIFSVGQAICNGPGSTTYRVSFSELSGATISTNAGIRSGNIINNIPIGTNLMITASNSSCNFSYTITSPASCTNPCENPRISISGPFCSPDISNYYVNYVSIPGATVSSDFGAVKPGQITDIPYNIKSTIIVRYPGCPDQTLEILPPVCKNTSALGEFVWHDLNANGQQDPGEHGFPGLQINLFRASGAYITTTFTNPLGKYLFENLYPGSYYLEFKTPAGFERTFSNRGNDNTDNDIDGINGPGTTSATLLTLDEKDFTLSAGFYKCVPVGDLVWYDINKNDVWDSNENGINGLIVNLWRNNSGSWDIYDFKYTGQKPGTPSDDGYFLFCAPPGEYYLEVIMPPLGLVRARPNIGNNEEFDSDIKSNGSSDIFQLISGQTKTDFGAGFYPMALAGNLVWKDNNVNGIQDANEPRVPGIKVEAIELGTGKVVRTTFTNDDGIYKIEYLEKQQYYIRFAPPSGFGATVPRATSDNLDSDVDHSYGPYTTRGFLFEPGLANDNIDMGLAFGVLPVDWLDIYARRVNNSHIISWSVSGEVNVSHYLVERRRNNENDFRPISGKVDAKGNSNQLHNYDYTDSDSESPGTYYYRVKQVDFDGQFTYSNVVKLDFLEENQVRLYPNPARSETSVQISLAHDAEVLIEMYDGASKLVKVFKFAEVQKSGEKTYVLNLEDVPVGAYNISISINGAQVIRKLIRIE